MLDKNGVLPGLLRTLRQKAASEVCQMLRDIASELECESEPLEEYGQADEPEGFEALWADR